MVKLTRDSSMYNCSIFQLDCHCFMAQLHQKPVNKGKKTNGNKQYSGIVSGIIQPDKDATLNPKFSHLTSFMVAS